jgi:hypothetical protein
MPKLKLTEKKKKELRSYLLQSDNFDFGEPTPAQVAVKAVTFIEGLLDAKDQSKFFLQQKNGTPFDFDNHNPFPTLFGGKNDW